MHYFSDYVLPFIFLWSTGLQFLVYWYLTLFILPLLLSISVFKLTEFFISAIKSLISKSSFLFSKFYCFLFSEFWMKNLLTFIFLLSTFSPGFLFCFVFLTFSFMLKAFLKCPRMLCCSFIFGNKVYLHALYAWFATSSFAIGHN